MQRMKDAKEVIQSLRGSLAEQAADKDHTWQTARRTHRARDLLDKAFAKTMEALVGMLPPSMQTPAQKLDKRADGLKNWTSDGLTPSNRIRDFTKYTKGAAGSWARVATLAKELVALITEAVRSGQATASGGRERTRAYGAAQEVLRNHRHEKAPQREGFVAGARNTVGLVELLLLQANPLLAHPAWELAQHECLDAIAREDFREDEPEERLTNAERQDDVQVRLAAQQWLEGHHRRNL